MSLSMSLPRITDSVCNSALDNRHGLASHVHRQHRHHERKHEQQLHVAGHACHDARKAQQLHGQANFDETLGFFQLHAREI